MPKVWRRGGNAGADRVPVWKNQKGEGRKWKEGVGDVERDEVGQLGCVGIKEVGENGGFGSC